jgi:hypothetical protein
MSNIARGMCIVVTLQGPAPRQVPRLGPATLPSIVTKRLSTWPTNLVKSIWALSIICSALFPKLEASSCLMAVTSGGPKAPPPQAPSPPPPPPHPAPGPLPPTPPTTPQQSLLGQQAQPPRQSKCVSTPTVGGTPTHYTNSPGRRLKNRWICHAFQPATVTGGHDQLFFIPQGGRNLNR